MISVKNNHFAVLICSTPRELKFRDIFHESNQNAQNTKIEP